MNLSDYVQHDALSLAGLVRSGQVSEDELAQTALRACAAVNPQINAVIETWPDDVPQAIATVPDGSAFAGVPFLIKDAVLHMAGKRCEIGSRLAAGLVASEDTHLMRRFRSAGFVTLGRTAAPEMAFSCTTESVLNGPTRNPWNLARSTGGSSGGAAAAVAAGIVPLAHANDGGGSTRIPAACCGLVGLKPSRGRVPVGPDADEGLNGLGIELAVSRTVRDTAALLDEVQGAEVGDAYIITPPARPYLQEVAADPASLNIGFLLNAWGGLRTEPVVAEVVTDTARLLDGLGHGVEPVAPELGVSWDAFIAANACIWSANLAAWIGGLAAVTGRPIDDSTLEIPTLAAYEYGRRLSALDLLSALDVRNRVERSMGAYFEQFDILMTPTLPELPVPIGLYGENLKGIDGLAWADRLFSHAPFTPVFNISGLPAMSLPLGHDAASNLPIGVQFVARFGREDLLIALAGQIERAAPWIDRRPKVWAGRFEAADWSESMSLGATR